MRILDRETARKLETLGVSDDFSDNLKIEVIKKEHKSTDKKGNQHTTNQHKLLLTACSTNGPPRASYQIYQFFNRFPFKTKRAVKNFEEKYEVPFTDLSLAIIENVWPRIYKKRVYQCQPQVGDVLEAKGVKVNVSFLTPKSLLLYSAKLAAEVVGDSNAKRTAAYKNTGEVDFWTTTTTNQNTDLVPAPHQKAAAINCLKANTALWMEQGTGKTLCGIIKVETEANKKEDTDKNPYRVLVLCPKNVRENWRREINKFATLPHRATVVRGAKATERVAEVVTAILPFQEAKYCAVIMGYESYVRTEQYLKNIEWDCIILDEAHHIANPATARTQSILRLRKNSKSRIPMTGTPFKNSIVDLYSQLEFLFEGASGASSLKEFKQMHEEIQDLQNGIAVVTGLKNIPMLQERLSRLSFMVTKEEVMPDLPKKTFDIIECAMTHQQAKVYKQVASYLYAELKDDLTGETNSLTANHVLTKLLRLAEITSGYVCWDAEISDNGELIKDKQIETFDSAPGTTSSMKIDVLIDEIKNKKPWQKTLVWCCFKHNVAKISARLKLEGIECVTYTGLTSDKDRQIAEDRFNNDVTCKVFIGNPRAGGTGLNLLGYNKNAPESTNTNCDHVIYYSYNWSWNDRSQSQDRAHRRGTRVPVRVSVMLIPNSIDEEIDNRITLKQQTGMAITDVRELLAKIASATPSTNGD